MANGCVLSCWNLCNCFIFPNKPPSSNVPFFPHLLPSLPLALSFWSIIDIQKWKKVKVKLLSHVRLFATPWPVAYQASWSMGFSRQEYWSGLPFPSPGDLGPHQISWIFFLTLLSDSKALCKIHVIFLKLQNQLAKKAKDFLRKYMFLIW